MVRITNKDAPLSCTTTRCRELGCCGVLVWRDWEIQTLRLDFATHKMTSRIYGRERSGPAGTDYLGERRI